MNRALIAFLAAAAPAAALAAAAPSAPVPPPSPARIQAASALPDWKGVWRPNEADTHGAPPFNREWAAKAAASAAKLKTDPKSDPLSDCLPLGLLRMMSLNGHFEFTLTPEQLWVFSGTPPGPQSTGAQTRRVYLDGRDNLKGDDLFPTYTGNSVGKWEGGTLVIKTVGLNEDMFIDRTGAMLSGDATVTERIRLTGPDALEDRFTVEDKTALTRPWTFTRTFKRQPAGTAISDDSCLGKRVNPARLTDAAVAAKARGGR